LKEGWPRLALQYGAGVQVLSPLTRPAWFEEEAQRPRLGGALASVLGAGAVCAGLGVVSALLDHSGSGAVILSCLLPALFCAYWLLQAFCVDAAAGMVGRSGRRRLLLALTGFSFLTWIAYSALGVAEAAALRAGGSGAAWASGLQWISLPVIAWFLVLTVLAIRAVYRVSGLIAFAFALLPYAMLTAGLLLVGLALSALHAARLV